MLRIRSRYLPIAASVGLAAGVVIAAPAYASGPGGQCGVTSCDVYVPSPGSPGGSNTGGQGGNGTGTGSGGGSGSGSTNVPISNPTTPQTDAALCAATGGIYAWGVTVPGSTGFGAFPAMCIIPNGTPSDPSDPSSPPSVTPAQVAAMARDQISITAPAVGTAPCREADCMGAVGVPVWLWAEDGFPTRSATASAGGHTVTVTAKVSRIEWNMGDGTVVRCNTPGTAFKESMGFRDSPDCGHRYSKTGSYNVRATAHWSVTFSGSYSSSTTVPATSDAQLRIGEYQAIVTSG